MLPLLLVLHHCEEPGSIFLPPGRNVAAGARSALKPSLLQPQQTLVPQSLGSSWWLSAEFAFVHQGLIEVGAQTWPQQLGVV